MVRALALLQERETTLPAGNYSGQTLSKGEGRKKYSSSPLSSGNFDNSLYLDAKKPCPNGENPRKRSTPGKNLPFPVRQANTSHKYLEFYDSTIKIYKIRCAQCFNRPPFLARVTLPVDWP